MSKLYDYIISEFEDYKLLLRNIPSLAVSFYILSVVCMNLLANRELISYTYLAIDAGTTLSWIPFLCMDIICKRFGPKASTKIAILAIAINLFMCMLFYFIMLFPGRWGAFYSSGSEIANIALDDTFSGCWYVVLGSAVAMFFSALVNSILNWNIGKLLKSDGYKAFAIRSFISTGVGQFVDNFIFAFLVSKFFFGWTWTQVFMCSLTCAVVELMFEIIFSPWGYRVSKNWDKDCVGEDYLKKKN